MYLGNIIPSISRPFLHRVGLLLSFRIVMPKLREQEILGRDFRANPFNELVLFDRLETDLRQALAVSTRKGCGSDAVTEAVSLGSLFVLGGDARVRNDTLLGFAPTAGKPDVDPSRRLYLHAVNPERGHAVPGGRLGEAPFPRTGCSSLRGTPPIPLFGDLL